MTTLIVAAYSILAVLLFAAACGAFYEYVLAPNAAASRQREKEAIMKDWRNLTESK